MSSGTEEQQTPTFVTLSEVQLEDIAQRAAKRALENFYLEVGKVTIRSALYILGAGIIALAVWLGLNEKIKV